MPESLLEDYPVKTKQDRSEEKEIQPVDGNEEETLELEMDEDTQSLDTSILPEESTEEEDELITKAIDLFGEDNVNIIR